MSIDGIARETIIKDILNTIKTKFNKAQISLKFQYNMLNPGGEVWVKSIRNFVKSSILVAKTELSEMICKFTDSGELEITIGDPLKVANKLWNNLSNFTQYERQYIEVRFQEMLRDIQIEYHTTQQVANTNALFGGLSLEHQLSLKYKWVSEYNRYVNDIKIALQNINKIPEESILNMNGIECNG